MLEAERNHLWKEVQKKMCLYTNICATALFTQSVHTYYKGLGLYRPDAALC